MFNRTKKRLGDEVRARHRPLTDQQMADIVTSATSAQHGVVLSRDLARIVATRHPMRMARLEAELAWVAERASDFGLDVKVDLP